MNSMFTLALIQIIQLALADQIFPPSGLTNTSQWIYNYFVICGTQNSFAPTNCANNENTWIECYNIPTSGLCFKQNIPLSSSQSANFLLQFYNITSTQSVIVSVNGKDHPLTITPNNNSQLSMVTFTDTVSSTLSIKGSNLQLSSLIITSDCAQNCKTCNGTGICLPTGCSTNYFMYNSQCTLMSCLSVISGLSTSSVQSSTASLSDSIYTINIQFNVQLGTCLIPRVYLTAGVSNSSIIYVLDSSIITVNNNQVQIKMPLSTILQQCTQMKVENGYVYQCNYGVGLTFQDVTQFLLILVGQVTVNSQTNASSQLLQPLNVPSGSSMSGQLLVVSYTTNTTVDSQAKTITTTAVVADPQFKGYIAKYSSANVTQGDQIYTLNLVSQDSGKGSSQYVLSWTSSSFDPTQSFDLSVFSTLTPTQRLLAFIRSESSLNLMSQTIQTIGSGSSTTTTKPNRFSGSIEGKTLVIIILASFFVFLAVTAGLSLKQNQKK